MKRHKKKTYSIAVDPRLAEAVKAKASAEEDRSFSSILSKLMVEYVGEVAELEMPKMTPLVTSSPTLVQRRQPDAMVHTV